MIKSILKEICIMLLLCAAIVLILGVIFYDYIPTNKAIPNPLAAYTTPENIKSEIEEQIVEMEKQNVTYTITGDDLNLYKQTNSYKTGKPNPFSASTEVNNNQSGSTNSSNEQTNIKNNTDTSTKPTTDPNSTGTFFNDTGLK